MLFDLRGRRRRAVQVTYLSLAILMGVGLVGAGIGSDVSGGVFDIFTGDGGDGSDVNDATEKRIEGAEKRLAANPKDTAALAILVRGHYDLAISGDSNTAEFDGNDKKELEKASGAWKRYLAVEPEKPDSGLANVMLQVYDPRALNKPDEAVQVAELLARERDDPEGYVALVTYATLAGQKRKADLAAAKALELAPKGQDEIVKQQIEQAKAAAQPAEGAGGAQGGAQDDAPPGGG